ncbi:hypothetical protein ABPG74_010406 [Tetrahymena malaccensis]
MEQQPIYYDPSLYYETQTGNKLCKKNLIRGSDNIFIYGKVIMQQKNIIRGDLGRINLGKYLILCEGVTLRPSYQVQANDQIKYSHITIGDYVIIDSNSIIQAQKIGSNVHIGKNCIIGHRANISDNVKILDDTIIPPDTVIPPYTVYGGKPARYIAELPETVSYIHREQAIKYYKSFQPKRTSDTKEFQFSSIQGSTAQQ